MGNAAGEAAHRFHFQGLAQLLLEHVAFADILRDDQADGAARVLEVVRDNFDVNNLAVLLLMPALILVPATATDGLHLFAKALDWLLGANIKRGHGLEFFRGIAVVSNGG